MQTRIPPHVPGQPGRDKHQNLQLFLPRALLGSAVWSSWGPPGNPDGLGDTWDTWHRQHRATHSQDEKARVPPVAGVLALRTPSHTFPTKQN